MRYFLNIFVATMAAVATVLALCTGNYIAAAWAFAASVSQIEIAALKDHYDA